MEDFSSNKRMFWREVKERVLSYGSQVCDRWKEYFDGLLNVSESGRAEITARPGMNVIQIQIRLL